MDASRVALLLVYLLVLGAHPGAAQPQDDRSPDSLLTRPDLQVVVDLQIARDGQALIQRLQAPNPAIRARAAFALASIQDSAATAALLARLRDASPRVRADAAFALGQLPDGPPADSLLQALARESTPAVRRRLIEALGKTGDAPSLGALLQADLRSEEAPDRALALARYGMRDITTDAAVRHLLDLLNADAPEARLYAAYFFGRIDPAAWRTRAGSVREALDRLDADDPAAMHLVRGLGRLDDPADLSRFVRAAETGDWRTRVNAVRALGAYGDRPAAQDALRAALRTDGGTDAHVSITAAQTLSGLTPDSAMATSLADWVRAHPDRWRRTGPLLQALARAGRTDLVQANVNRWATQDAPVPYAAVLPALAYVPGDSAWTHLARAAEAEDPRVAASALRAVGTRWSTRQDSAFGASDPAAATFRVLAQGLRRADVATVNAAAPALADSVLAAQGAVEEMAEAYRTLSVPDDLEAMTALLQALGGTPGGEAEARAVLKAAADHSHPVIARTAREAWAERSGTEPEPLPPSAAPPDTPAVDWDALADAGTHPELVLETEAGTFVVEMDAGQAPQTVQTILRLAEAGRYDGVPFHRVIANFVIQGGDVARADGWGGPGFFLRSEFTRIPYLRGTAGMASAGKDTEGSQYFFTHSQQPHLDGRYTAFGRVVEGQAVVDRILADTRVLSATVR